MARLEPIHLKSSSAGIEVIRGTVYAEGYKVWNYDTDAWDEISVTSSGGSVDIGSGSASELYVESLTADKVWGFVDNDTIGINEEGKLYVKGVTPGIIAYPFGLDSLYLNFTSSPRYVFNEVTSTAYNNHIINQNVYHWNYEDNYENSPGVSGVQRLAYSVSAGTYLADSDDTTLPSQDNIELTSYLNSSIQLFNFPTLKSYMYKNELFGYWYFTVNTISAWDINNTLVTKPPVNKYYTLPVFVITGSDINVIDSTTATITAAIDAQGNEKIDPFIRWSSTTNSPIYTFGDEWLNQQFRLYFAVPIGHLTSNSYIEMNSAIAWSNLISTTGDDTFWLGPNGEFEYALIKTEGTNAPVESANLEFRINY